jgi:hypothetical protein
MRCFTRFETNDSVNGLLSGHAAVFLTPGQSHDLQEADAAPPRAGRGKLPRADVGLRSRDR